SVIFLADWLPGIAGAVMGGFLLWQYTMNTPPRHFELMDLLQPLAAMLICLVIMHILIALCLPLRWQVIRAQIYERLEKRLREELEEQYHQILTDVTTEVLAERRQNENF